MITLENVRAAQAAGNPYDAMDELVRAELAAGRTTRQIVDEMRPIIDVVLETPGLTEDGEEAFLSVLDALTGNCRADQCYQDPVASGVAPVSIASLPGEQFVAAVVPKSSKKRKRSSVSTAADPGLSTAIERRLAVNLMRLGAAKPDLKQSEAGAAMARKSQTVHATGVKSGESSEEVSYRIVIPVGERRGAKLLKGRSARRLSKGIYLIPHGDLIVLADANIPFAFVGVIGG